MLDQVLMELSHKLSFDAFFLLAILVALEAVLSADNAIALASISKGLEDKQLQRKALNTGLVLAFVLRVVLILTATWVIHYWQFQLLGALYLLWLVFQYFTTQENEEDDLHGPQYTSLWQVIPLIAMTDLAFSLDSVTTAIAISDEIWLVIAGASLGIIALRFMAGLFIQWIQDYAHLEKAGYITVGFVGLRLLLRVVHADYLMPEWLLVGLTIGFFIWGFSERTAQQDPE
ncbi:MAG: TerC family protein [Microcoleaceae cyanobacterium]